MGTTKNPFSGVEDTSEFETVDTKYETHFESEFESRTEPVLDETPSPTPQQENDRPTRT